MSFIKQDGVYTKQRSSHSYMIQLNRSSPALVHKCCYFITKFVISRNSIPPLTRTHSKYRAPAELFSISARPTNKVLRELILPSFFQCQSVTPSIRTYYIQ